jgi:hypothetical protein
MSTLALYRICSDSAWNYQLIDMESTVRISSVDCKHLPSTGQIVIPPGITSSWKLIQTARSKCAKIVKTVIISGSAISNPIYCAGQLFFTFKYENVFKMKNKPDPALSEGSDLFNEIKKRTPKSWESIPLMPTWFVVIALPPPPHFAFSVYRRVGCFFLFFFYFQQKTKDKQRSVVSSMQVLKINFKK